MIRMSVENPRYDYDRWPPRLGEAHAATTVRPLDARSRGRKMMGRSIIRSYPNHACPLTQSMAATALGITDPVVKKLISPEALSELLAGGWPITVVPDPLPDTIGITWNTIGTIWQIFGNSEYGLGRFEVAAPAALPQQQRFRLAFRLLQWRWDWSASPSLRLFRTCLEMSSSRRCERPHKDGDRQMT
jgi:hypothetical protein